MSKFDYNKFFDKREKKIRAEKIFVATNYTRICENSWHQEVIIKSFERCPICFSEAYHKIKIR